LKEKRDLAKLVAAQKRSRHNIHGER